MKINNIYCGDNLQIMKQLSKESVDLIYLDPPFFTQRDFVTSSAGFSDKWKGGMEEYLLFMKDRLVECHRLLKPTGSIFLHCDYRANYRLRMILNEVFGEKRFINEIIWCYETAGAGRKSYSHKHDTIYFFSKTKDYNFYPKRIKEYRSPLSVSRAKYKGGRTGSLGMLYRYPLDVFKIPAILGPVKERKDYPTQKPLALLERIIKGSSDQGDLVLDPFCGSGTTCLASYKLNRKWIGIDVSKKAVEIAKKRVITYS